MTPRFPRFLSAALLALASLTMLGAAFDAEAQRLGRGASIGRQSSGILSRQAVRPPAAPSAAANSAVPRAPAATAGAAAGTAAGAAARSGGSRWFGPVAGIAAGLGIAALLSHFGLGGALLETVSSLVLVGLVAAAVMFLLRRLRAGAASPRPALQGVGSGASGGAFGGAPGGVFNAPMQRADLPTAPAAPAAFGSAAPASPAVLSAGDAAIPAGFDVPAFLAEAKKQFGQIQQIWNDGDVARLREYLTDDLVAEITPQLAERAQTPHAPTQVVLLNAELLGVERVRDGGFDGHLASLRFSGMLREGAAEAFRFEEVWNLYKSDGSGWLLAGIQQIPVEYAS